MKKSRILYAVVAVLMLAALMAGCNKDTTTSSAPPAPESSAPAPESSAPAPAPALSSLEQLLNMDNKRPLAGLQPGHLESRASINKALPVTDDGHITIAWASASQASSFFTEMTRSAKAACDKYGYEFLMQVTTDFSLEEQITQIENFLTQDIDFLVVNAIDIDATVVYYQQAVDMGVPVIVVGPTAGKHEYPIVTTVLSGSFESGWVVGEYVAEKLFNDYNGKELEVGFVFSRTDDADSNSRPCGFVGAYLYKQAELNGKPYASRWDAALDGYNYWTTCINSGSSTIPGIMKLLGYEPGGGTDTYSGQVAAEKLLTRFAKMDLLFADTDSLSPGVLQAITEAGMTPGEDILVCTGADAADYTLLNIIDGKILATGTNAPYYTGESVVELIQSIFNGFDANDLPASSYTPTYCVNVDNVNNYYNPDLKFAPALPWDVETVDQYNTRNANA